MLCPQLVRPFGWMERVGEQQKLFDESGLGRGEHRGLPASVGVAAEKDAGGESTLHDVNCCTQAGLIPLGASARRRSVRACLAEWEIAAENGEAGCAKSIGEGGEKRRFAVRSRAVRQYEGARAGERRTVEKSTNLYSI